MMVLVIAAIYFAAVWLGNGLKLFLFIPPCFEKAAKRLFGIPNFRHYALGDGIKEISAGYLRHYPANTAAVCQGNGKKNRLDRKKTMWYNLKISH